MPVIRTETDINLDVIQDNVKIKATLNKADETITIKDFDQLDFRIVGWSKNKLDDLIAALTDISTAATTEFAA
mgnify:CR=1 FL=1